MAHLSAGMSYLRLYLHASEGIHVGAEVEIQAPAMIRRDDPGWSGATRFSDGARDPAHLAPP